MPLLLLLSLLLPSDVHRCCPVCWEMTDCLDNRMERVERMVHLTTTLITVNCLAYYRIERMERIVHLMTTLVTVQQKSESPSACPEPFIWALV